MERTFGKRSINNQRGQDRFIPPREGLCNIRKKYNIKQTCDDGTIDIKYAKGTSEKQFSCYMGNAFGLETYTVIDEKFSNSQVKESYLQPWPCRPRKKKYLSSADSVLDLPSYNTYEFPDLLDWGNDNILVAALGKKYYKWSWRTQNLVSEGFAESSIQCCQFDPKGQLLALGTKDDFLELHHNGRNKRVGCSYCDCRPMGPGFCSVTAIDWSPTGNSLAAGCCNGTISSITREGLRTFTRNTYLSSILSVKVSPDARYVASIGIQSSVVLVMCWPSLRAHYCVNAEWITRTIAWHPWRSSLLGIGAVTSDLCTRIALWDVAPGRVRTRYIGHSELGLDTLLFSARTGELVLGLWDPEVAPSKASAQLLVLSDTETVVDEWGTGKNKLDRVRAMIFNPDGSKLAVATAEEDLIIFNYLPEEKKVIKKFSSLPTYLDKLTYGYSLR